LAGASARFAEPKRPKGKRPEPRVPNYSRTGFWPATSTPAARLRLAVAAWIIQQNGNAARPSDERGSPACEDGATPSGRSITPLPHNQASETASPDGDSLARTLA